MAAVTTSAPSSPTRRIPVPLPELSPVDRLDWDENAKPLPGVPLAESPRLRQPPISPVRVNFQPDDWAKPSNVDIENTYPEQHAEAVHALDRAMPQTPEAPAPPPHNRLQKQSGQHNADRSGLIAKPSDARLDHEMPIRTIPSENAQGRQENRSSQDARDHSAARIAPRGMRNPEFDDVSTRDALRTKDVNRQRRSRDTDTTTASTAQQQASTESSARTSASSVSGINEVCDSPSQSGEPSPESSVIEESEPVPQFQYHHSAFLPRPPSIPANQDPKTQSNPDLAETAATINRHLTPTSSQFRRSSLPRPQSTYSVYSDSGARGRASPALLGGSPHNRTPSSSSRKSPETRMSSYAELLNVPYPQPAPAPISFDNSQLRNAVGSNASLLSTQKTLDMYRANVKKTNDASIQYAFAVFLISTAQELGLTFDEPKRTKSPKLSKDIDSSLEGTTSSPQDLVREARAILQKLSNNGYPFAQYYLADGYASGLFSKGKEDYNSAFPLFVLAAKHGHAESAYRTGLCYEFGWGCRKDPTKAIQFLRTAASKRHPGAMTRLGIACLSGDLGEKRYREGLKWLKLASEAADNVYNAAPYHLGLLYETGYGDDIFKDESYAADLFTQASDLGHPDANFRMGDAYEHGKLNCPRDPALSVHFYTGAAERGHVEAMMGLCAWYLVGAEPVLDKDEEEAYEWARRAAELGLLKAQYAVGYFTEMGIGCRRDILEANVWYVKAAEAGDERAKQRLAAIKAASSGGTPMEVAPPRNGKIKKHVDKDKECVVM